MHLLPIDVSAVDTKIPAMQTDAVYEHLSRPAPEGVKPLTEKGESNPLARDRATVAALGANGVKLSDRELQTARPDGSLPWIDGRVANIINPEAGFIKAATDASLPLKAGISGTTFRFMGTADVLGADPAMARLAAVGTLQSIDAHSFHEIASAAQGFAGGYDPSTPYTPSSTGLTQQQLEELAIQHKLSLADLNGAPRSPDQTMGPSSQ